MNNKDILEEIERKFDESKKRIGFKSTLDEIDEAFFVRDFIIKEGFVSENFSRQMCSRMFETLSSWSNYLHSLVLPNPHNIMNANESKIFNEEEKKRFMKLMGKSMAITSTNILAGLSKNEKTEAEFIDGAVEFWNKTLSPELIKTMDKINQKWKE